jgi:uncharacterized repeat protein (TIGR03809 family)
MTHPTDVARGRDIVARWCELAEQRLEHLTELFETGRWRRYHSERAFLENVREAKSAVETWRSLMTSEASPDNLPVDLSWIGKRSTVPQAKRNVPIEPIVAPAELPEAAPVSVVPAMTEPEPEPAPEPEPELEPEPVLALEPVETDESALDKTLALTLDIVAMQERYPLLRNTL